MLRIFAKIKRLFQPASYGDSAIYDYNPSTQYTEGDVDATITGNAIMWEDTGDTLRAVSAAKPLPVSIDVALSNLAWESGGFLEQAATALDNIYGNTVTPVTENGAVNAGVDRYGVVSLGYSFNGTDWGRNKLDTDDGTIAAGQVTQLVISQLYGYSGTAWNRVKVNNGSLEAILRGGSSDIGDGVAASLQSLINSDSQHVVVRTAGWYWNGSSFDKVRGTAADGALVNLGSNNDVIQSTHDNFNANANIQVGNTDVSTTNPVPTKGVPSDIDINGNNANHADKYYTNAGAVTDGIIWSPAAGKRWHVLTLYINVSAAATVTIEDDLAAGDNVRWKGELAANSGVVLTYDKEHPFCSGEDAADLLITTTAGNVYVQAVGYEV